MLRHINDLLLNSIISGIIGLIVGIAIILIEPNPTTHWIIFNLIYSFILGIFIGSISRLLVIEFYFRKRISLKLTLLIIFCTIALVVSSESIYNYLVYNKSILSMQLLIALLISETLGLSFCYISIKNSIDLNEKLNIKKLKLSKKN
ncbi:MAG: hypothetical protein N4A54_02810 [Peptostreptococcaceae bacterium]|jgi:H+/Cl- antiporter ClcA|nr:hypothetical protein [Peptostreptococcaceae bacterium]